MKSPWLVSGLGLFLIVALLAAQKSTRNEANFLQMRINCCIGDLDNPEFQEKAIAELVAIGPAAVEPVENAIVAKPSDSLKKALDCLVVHGAGGAIVNGLKLRLTSDKQAIRPGESMVLTTTINNMRDVEMSVFLGWQHSGNDLETGSDLRASFIPARVKGQKDEVQTIGGGGICGNGLVLAPLLLTLPPKSAATYATETTFLGSNIASSASDRNGRRSRDTRFGPVFELLQTESIYVVGKYQRYFLPATIRGTHRFRIVHEVKEGLARNRGNDKWTGCVRSNDVDIQVLPASSP